MKNATGAIYKNKAEEGEHELAKQYFDEISPILKKFDMLIESPFKVSLIQLRQSIIKCDELFKNPLVIECDKAYGYGCMIDVKGFKARLAFKIATLSADAIEKETNFMLSLDLCNQILADKPDLSVFMVLKAQSLAKLGEISNDDDFKRVKFESSVKEFIRVTLSDKNGYDDFDTKKDVLGELVELTGYEEDNIKELYERTLLSEVKSELKDDEISLLKKDNQALQARVNQLEAAINELKKQGQDTQVKHDPNQTDLVSNQNFSDKILQQRIKTEKRTDDISTVESSKFARTNNNNVFGRN